ncbi:MAG: nucleoside phosphorylase [Chloroflexi bacterium]|nr:nucleoside phosphorylase [Chloroflexota bacterium]MCL5074321.1 nucleoside phosphorylase [Chloroflexota bacterium]
MRPKPEFTPPSEFEGLQKHLLVKKGDLPRYVLTPGDPGRVPRIGKFWDEYEEVKYHREFRVARGRYKGVDIGACSTGVGGPSTDIAVVEMTNIGVDTFIRVGGAAGLQKDIEPGDLVIHTGAMRLTGAPRAYIGDEYPAVASYEVVLALIEACERLGFNYHVGLTASNDSFYAGEANPIPGGYWPSRLDHHIEDLSMAKIATFEMEAATLFVLANLFGLRAGCICVTGSNRITRVRKPIDYDKACQAACEAVRVLAEWDGIKERHQKRHLFPSLLQAE